MKNETGFQTNDPVFTNILERFFDIPQHLRNHQPNCDLNQSVYSADLLMYESRVQRLLCILNKPLLFKEPYFLPTSFSTPNMCDIEPRTPSTPFGSNMKQNLSNRANRGRVLFGDTTTGESQQVAVETPSVSNDFHRTSTSHEVSINKQQDSLNATKSLTEMETLIEHIIQTMKSTSCPFCPSQVKDIRTRNRHIRYVLSSKGQSHEIFGHRFFSSNTSFWFRKRYAEAF